MRQVRWIISDQPRISALRVDSPTDARDAPLQGPWIPVARDGFRRQPKETNSPADKALMQSLAVKVAYAVAVVAGVVSWVYIAQVSGRREPWDDETYFTAVLPALGLLGGVLGFVVPEKPWRWGLIPFRGPGRGGVCPEPHRKPPAPWAHRLCVLPWDLCHPRVRWGLDSGARPARLTSAACGVHVGCVRPVCAASTRRPWSDGVTAIVTSVVSAAGRSLSTDAAARRLG